MSKRSGDLGKRSRLTTRAPARTCRTTNHAVARAAPATPRYLYSANRLKYPLMRKRLMKMWREAKVQHSDPVEAWASIIEDADKAKSFKQARGRGGFVRSSRQEVNELIAASNVYTVKTYGPDRVVGFSPIPAMSMVSYASGARYLSLIGGTCLSFYDWYCDLPPASPMTLGRADRCAGIRRLV